MNLEGAMLNEISWSKRDKYSIIPLYEEARIVKFMESESRMVGASGLAGVMERHCFNGVDVWYFAKWKKSGDELWWSRQLLNRVWFFVTPWTAARQASLSITNSRSLLKLMSISSVKPSNHLILCHLLLLLPSVFPSIRVCPLSQLFISGVWSFGVSASVPVLPMNIQLISFRNDRLISLQSKGFSRVFPKPQFKSISSSILSLLYGPTLTPIYDYWKNHSFD